MRLLFVFIILIFSVAVKAQSPFLGLGSYAQSPVFARGLQFNDSGFNKKWFFTHYTGISTSFSFFRGGNTTVVSAPIGLQLNRRLNDNLYAFAGVAAAPAYINFNQAFLNTNINKGLQGKSTFRQNSFGLYSRAEVGLMYVNDAKTFSISGSIGVETNSFPAYNYYPSNITTNQQQHRLP